jgi:hypothetical protein
MTFGNMAMAGYVLTQLVRWRKGSGIEGL